jgi:hypothetical protein
VGTSFLLSPFSQLTVEFPGEYAGFYPAKAPQPPIGSDDPLNEQILQIPYGLQFGTQVLAQLSEGVFVFSREKTLF